MKHKPFAHAADQNRHDILAVLKNELGGDDHVLELGSGTGQHACHFAKALPELVWQPSELAENLSGITQWMDEQGSANIRAPLELDMRWSVWPALKVQACYTANTLHIVSWQTIESLFNGCAQVLLPGGKLLAYGPFAIDGQHTAPSNARFDQFLRSENPDSGVRDISELDRLAAANGFSAARLIEMPVNNFIAVWERNA